MNYKIEKIISKTGEVVPYQPEKIINSIKKTIVDVEEIPEWMAHLRAEKYFKLVHESIYNEFYNIDTLFESLLKRYLSFLPVERYERIKNSFLFNRLCTQIFLLFKEDKITVNKEKIKKLIVEEIDNFEQRHKKDMLFPLLTENEKQEIINFITDKVFEISKEEITYNKLYPTREFIMDIIESVLRSIGEIELAEGFMIFREGKKKLRDGEITQEQFTSNGIHTQVCEKTLAWNIAHECENVFDLNDWVVGRKGKDIRELIKLSDERFLSDLFTVIEKILYAKDRIRIIIIAGPSSSNKTTTTIIIGNELAKHGLKLKQINVDDYFKDLKDQPKDEFGDYDFEMPEAIDIELFNKHLELLLKGETIQKPCYNFKLGKRDRYVPFKLENDEFLLIDCLHGLYKKLTIAVPDKNKFKIYIESMNILRDIQNHYTRWTDVRMLKRMIRDVKYRNHKPEQTLAHWPYVRKGELKHIIPYIFSTDIVINSGLPYELPALKKALENLYPSNEFIENLRKEGRVDPYIRGIRVKVLLQTIESINNLDIIPPTSPLREFIGGSAYLIPHNE